jgi:hypothetical protein
VDFCTFCQAFCGVGAGFQLFFQGCSLSHPALGAPGVGFSAIVLLRPPRRMAENERREQMERDAWLNTVYVQRSDKSHHQQNLLLLHLSHKKHRERTDARRACTRAWCIRGVSWTMFACSTCIRMRIVTIHLCVPSKGELFLLLSTHTYANALSQIHRVACNGLRGHSRVSCVRLRSG